MAWEEFFIPSGGGVLKRQLFTSNGTWNKPEKLVGGQVWVTMIGGGSSGNATGTYNGLDGASGQYFIRHPVDVSADTSVPVTVGAGGASVVGDTSVSNAGEPSSFGAHLTALGGTPAANTNVYTGPLNGGNPGMLNRAISGDFGASPGVSPYAVGGSYTCGGSGLRLDDTEIKAGDGTGGRPGGGGQGYGAGGGSASSTGTSGAGAQGAVMIEWMESA